MDQYSKKRYEKLEKETESSKDEAFEKLEKKKQELMEKCVTVIPYN